MGRSTLKKKLISSTALWTAVNLVNIIFMFLIFIFIDLGDNKYHHMKKYVYIPNRNTHETSVTMS